MRWYEEVTVALVMLLWLGGPLFCFYTSVILLLWGTWTQVGYFCAAYLILGFHPLPNLEVKMTPPAIPAMPPLFASSTALLRPLKCLIYAGNSA